MLFVPYGKLTPMQLQYEQLMVIWQHFRYKTIIGNIHAYDIDESGNIRLASLLHDC